MKQVQAGLAQPGSLLSLGEAVTPHAGKLYRVGLAGWSEDVVGSDKCIPELQ